MADPNSQRWCLAVAVVLGTDSGADIFKSTDGGSTWSLLPHDQQAVRRPTFQEFRWVDKKLTGGFHCVDGTPSTQLYMAADTYDGVEAIAGAIGFWGQTAVSSVTDDGDVFEAVNYVYASVEVLRLLARRRSSQGTLDWVGFLRGSPLFSAMQSVTSAGNNTFYMVGYWLDSWNSTDGDVRSGSSTRSKR